MRLGVSVVLVGLAVLLSSASCKKTATGPDGNVNPPPPPSQDPNILSLSNGTGAPGDTGIVIDVDMHNVIPIAGVQLRMVYDSTVLQMSDSAYFKPPRAAQMCLFTVNYSTPGVIIGVITYFPCPPAKIDIGDGPVLQLIFDVKSTAPAGSYPLKFENNPPQINSLSDTTGYKSIFPQLINSTFTVK